MSVVRCPYMHSMSRLPTTRPHSWSDPFLPYTLPFIHRIYCRVDRSPTREGISKLGETKIWHCNTWWELSRFGWRTQTIPINLEAYSLGTWSERVVMPFDHFCGSLLLHTSSLDWDVERAACHYSLAEDRFLRLYQSWSSSCIPAPIEKRRGCASRDIQQMSLPTKCHFQQLALLLVGTNVGISASLSEKPKG